jgi:hypothetical protein
MLSAFAYGSPSNAARLVALWRLPAAMGHGSMVPYGLTELLCAR